VAESVKASCGHNTHKRRKSDTTVRILGINDFHRRLVAPRDWVSVLALATGRRAS